MSKLVIAPLALLLVSSPALAEPLGGGSKVLQLREKIATALSLPAGVKADLLDVVVKHIDSTGDWSLKLMAGDDLYGAEQNAKAMRFFTVIIVKDGRTFIDSFSYEPHSGQMILTEVENLVLPITVGVENSKKMAADEKYEKVNEAATSAIYHKKGYLEDVAFSVNNETNAVIKTYSSVFYDTIRAQPAAASTFGRRPGKP